MTEAAILYEVGDYWISREKGSPHVWRITATHSVIDSAYPATTDGMAIARARVDYLAASRQV